jgi:hypothetical protein
MKKIIRCEGFLLHQDKAPESQSAREDLINTHLFHRIRLVKDRDKSGEGGEGSEGTFDRQFRFWTS